MPITTPVSTSASSGSWPRSREPIQYTSRPPRGRRRTRSRWMQQDIERKKDRRARRPAQRRRRRRGCRARRADCGTFPGTRFRPRRAPRRRPALQARAARAPAARLFPRSPPARAHFPSASREQGADLRQRDRIAADRERERGQAEERARRQDVRRRAGTRRSLAAARPARPAARRAAPRSARGDRTGGGTRRPWRAGRGRKAFG